MALSKGQKVILFAAFGAAILSIIAHILIQEWYRPDLRYESGSYYISGPIAVTSLKLSNFGHSDAEEIKVVANFKEIIKGVTIDTIAVPLRILAGGKNNNFVSCEIPRLVHDQEIYLYFEVENKSPVGANLTKDFIQEIIYKGGKGKKGQPVVFAILLLVIGAVIAIVIPFFVEKSLRKRIYIRKRELIEKRQKEYQEKLPEYHDQIIGLIHMATEDAADLVPLSEFEVKVDKYLENVEFKKMELKQLAMKKYNLELKA